MTRLIAVGLLLLSLAATFASAQTRVNDKDIAAMMNNLKSDTNLFRSAFNTSVKKSTIRKTSKEKDSKALVQSFDNQVQAMQRTFKEKETADAQVSIVMNSGGQIDQLVRTVSTAPIPSGPK